MKTLKNTLYLGATALIVMSFAPQAYADSSMHKSMEHHSQASAEHKEIMGSGIVHSVDLESRKINLSHEAIPALKWPEMTMDLDVSEDVDLDALSSDDAIQFHIKLGEDKVYRITKIIKSNKKMDHSGVKSDSHGSDNHQH